MSKSFFVSFFNYGWILLPISILIMAGVCSADSGYSMGVGTKSHSQNNVLRHWHNSLGGYSASFGLLSVDPKQKGFLELELDLGLGQYKEFVERGKLQEQFGFTSIDLRLGLQWMLSSGDVAPHLGFGGILFNGFAPDKNEGYIEENVYKGLGIYFSVGPSFILSDEFMVICDLNYAYMGNIAKDDYDPMGILELRLRMVFISG